MKISFSKTKMFPVLHCAADCSGLEKLFLGSQQRWMTHFGLTGVYCVAVYFGGALCLLCFFCFFFNLTWVRKSWSSHTSSKIKAAQTALDVLNKASQAHSGS